MTKAAALKTVTCTDMSPQRVNRRFALPIWALKQQLPSNKNLHKVGYPTPLPWVGSPCHGAQVKGRRPSLRYVHCGGSTACDPKGEQSARHSRKEHAYSNALHPGTNKFLLFYIRLQVADRSPCGNPVLRREPTKNVMLSGGPSFGGTC